MKIDELDLFLYTFLIRLQENKVQFPEEIQSEDNIIERYSVFRSMRQALDIRALEVKVALSDIDIVNRWKSIETSKGK